MREQPKVGLYVLALIELARQIEAGTVERPSFCRPPKAKREDGQ
jgi:hypothetical protein